jgi:phospho-N-acetylmuramoyl-pentapeptide-transferase
LSNFSYLYLEAAKIVTYSILAFFVSMWWAPILIKLLVSLKFWKKKTRSVDSSGKDLQVTKKFYEENETNRKVPRAGGILIWVTTVVFAFSLWFILKIEPSLVASQFLNFVSRKETFIPIGTLILGSIIGLVDDALVIMEDGGNYAPGGLRLAHRTLFVLGLSIIIGIWFHLKIDLHKFSFLLFDINLDSIKLPFDITGRWLVIPMTSIILLGIWSSGIIDGFDGLAAGVFIPVYICFAGLSFAKGFYNISTLLMVIVGCTFAYLWFNIAPAKFFMGDTGTVGILLTLGVVAILIDYIYILPIAGFILILTSASAVIQVLSKKIFKRKVFLAAPLHHHLEAIGLSKSQITHRYWLISIITSIIGLVIGLIFKK